MFRRAQSFLLQKVSSINQLFSRDRQLNQEPQPISLVPESQMKGFSKALAHTFGKELADNIQIDDPDEALLFQTILSLEQIRDQYLAHLQVESLLQNLDLKKMTALQLIDLIKSLHCISAKSLMTVTAKVSDAGELLRHSIFIRRETGNPQFQFDAGGAVTENNIHILKVLHGDAVAHHFKNFFHFLFTKISDDPGRSDAEFKDLVIDFIRENMADPHCQAYLLVYILIDRREIPGKLLNFAERLLEMVRRDEDPFDCAAFTLFSLIDGHFFEHANRRTARMIMNMILLSLKQAELIIPKEFVSEYYEAIESSTLENLQPIKTVLAKYVALPKVLESFAPLSRSLYPLQLSGKDYHFVCHDHYYRVEESKDSGVEFQFSSQFLNVMKDIKMDRDFLLQKALKYSKSHPKLAKFYYEVATERLLSSNPSAVLNVEAVYQQVTENAKPYEVVYLAPNETGRIRKNRVKVGFWIDLLPHEMAVIFKDTKGNVSVTHADDATRLEMKTAEGSTYFFLREMKCMDGDFTVDMIKHIQSPMKPQHEKAIYEMLNNTLQLKALVKNSKGQTTFRVTKTGSILITADTLHQPQKNQFEVILNKANEAKDLSHHPLAGFQMIEPALCNEYRKIRRQAFSAVALQHEMPVLIFDNAWTGDYLIAYENKIKEIAITYQERRETKPETQLEEVISEKLIAVRAANPSCFPPPKSPEEAKQAISLIQKYMACHPAYQYHSMHTIFKSLAVDQKPVGLTNPVIDCIISYTFVPEEISKHLSPLRVS